MWITNMTVAVCMSCTNKTHWEKAERISTEQRFTQLRPWQSSLGPGLKCIESGDIWRIADHLVHNYEEVISNIFKRSWNMNMEYVYLYNIIYMHIHTLHTNCFDQFIDFRQIQTKTPLSSFALFRIDTSGRGVLPHSARDWSVIHGFNICNGLKWNVYLRPPNIRVSSKISLYKPILRPFQTAVKILAVS